MAAVAPVRLLILGDSGVGKTSLARLLTAGPAAPDPGVADMDDEEHPEVRVYVGAALLRGSEVPLEFLEPTDESFEGVAELHSHVDGVILAYDASRPETFQSLRSYWAAGVIEALKPLADTEPDVAEMEQANSETAEVLSDIRRRVLTGFARAKHAYDGVVREPLLVQDADASLLQAPVLFARCKAGAVRDRPAATLDDWEDEDAVAAARMDVDAALGKVDLVAFGAFLLHAIAIRRRRETDMTPM